MSKEERPELPATVTINELEVLTGFTRKTISERLKQANVERIPIDGSTNEYRIQDALKAVYARTKRVVQADQSSSDLDSEKLKLTAAKREMAELELSKKRQEVVSINDVLDAVADEYMLLRTELSSLHRSLAMELSRTNDPQECSSILEAAINKSLDNLTKDDTDSLLDALNVASNDLETVIPDDSTPE